MNLPIFWSGRRGGEEADCLSWHQVQARQTSAGTDQDDLWRGEHEEGHGGVWGEMIFEGIV